MSIHNEDELVAPHWLSQEFLQKVLRQDEVNDELEIQSQQVEPASLKGDHYASCMFRAKIVYRRSRKLENFTTCSLIIKCMPDEHTKKYEMLKESKIFETEISMYTETLPEIQRILAEHGDDTAFGPRVLYTSLKPWKVIIFEDLCNRGYDCVRGRPLRFAEYQAAFKKLAKLHAVSYAIGQSEEAQKVKQYQGMFRNDILLATDLMKNGVERIRRALESDDELRFYLPQFRVAHGDIFKGVFELYNAYKNGQDDGDIFVLNHGDFHSRNIMWKYDENGKLHDVMLIDFQISTYGPSTIDLWYATFMMLDAETRCVKRDEIFRFYFEHFIATLKRIDFQGTLTDFGQLQISILKYRRFAKYLLSTLMPFVSVLQGSIPAEVTDFDLADVMNNSVVLMAAYMNPQIIKHLKVLLPEFLKRGYLD